MIWVLNWASFRRAAAGLSDDKLGQGREAVKQLMVDNPDLANEIEGKIREKIKEMQGV